MDGFRHGDAGISHRENAQEALSSILGGNASVLKDLFELEQSGAEINLKYDDASDGGNWTGRVTDYFDSSPFPVPLCPHNTQDYAWEFGKANHVKYGSFDPENTPPSINVRMPAGYPLNWPDSSSQTPDSTQGIDVEDIETYSAELQASEGTRVRLQFDCMYVLYGLVYVDLSMAPGPARISELND